MTNIITPTNEIWYTTTNNAPITAKLRGSAKVEIVSEVFSDGKGVVTFSDTLTDIPLLLDGCIMLKSIMLPDTITKIGMWALKNCRNLESIIIPNNVTSIKASAFEGCSSLTSIVIPDGVLELDSYAFYNCTSLTEVVIPKSVTTIGKGVFAGCSKLTSISVMEGNQKYDSRGNCNAIISSDNNSLIAGCVSTVIPDGISSIAESAFCGMKDLISVTLPESITYIGNRAFMECSSLTNVVIPNGVTTIEQRCFENCTSLTSVMIPENINDIEGKCFKNCTSLTNLTFPGIEYINSEMFKNCASLTEITLLKGSVEICDDVFYGCNSLKQISIPNGIKAISPGAFAGCESLEIVTLPAGVNKMQGTSSDSYDTPFDDCDNLKAIYVPSKKCDFYKKRLPEDMHWLVVENGAELPINTTAKEIREVVISIDGREIEWEIQKKDETQWYGGLHCGNINNLQIEVDNERITDKKILGVLNSKIRNNEYSTIELGSDVKGIRCHTQRSSYSCKIEVCGEFKPKKLGFCVGLPQFTIGGEILSALDEPILTKLTYGTKEYDLEFISGRGISASVVWGTYEE